MERLCINVTEVKNNSYIYVDMKYGIISIISQLYIVKSSYSF